MSINVARCNLFSVWSRFWVLKGHPKILQCHYLKLTSSKIEEKILHPNWLIVEYHRSVFCTSSKSTHTISVPVKIPKNAFQFVYFTKYQETYFNSCMGGQRGRAPCFWGYATSDDWFWEGETQGRTQVGGFGIKNLSLEHDFLQNFITDAKDINCFCILFACYFVDLMQIPRNKFACKLQGTL